MSTQYTTLYEITDIQMKVMRYVTLWVKTKKTPIPRKEIVKEMQKQGEKDSTIFFAIAGLLKLGYIRNGVATSNKATYVQIRSI